MRKPSQRNSTRDREKAELTALRSLALELEAHLGALTCGEMTLTRSQLQARQGGKSAWRCLAERQAGARRTAEHTNCALNDRVQNNADWIQRLWELLHEERRAASVSSFKRATTLQRNAEDCLVLDQLKQQTQVAVTELPDVFAMHGIRVLDEAQGAGGDQLSDMWTHEQTGELQSTLVCVRRVPFDMHSTSIAMWTALSHPQGSYAADSSSAATPHDLTLKARVVERTPDVCVMKVQDTILLDTEATVVDYHAVVRRSTSTTPHGANVFAWQSLFTLADGSTRYNDTMWVAVVRCPSGSMESVVAIVSQSQLQTKVGFNGSVSLQVSIMLAVEGCVDSILSSTEDMLLRESLSGSSHSSSSSTTDETSVSITV